MSHVLNIFGPMIELGGRERIIPGNVFDAVNAAIIESGSSSVSSVHVFRRSRHGRTLIGTARDRQFTMHDRTLTITRQETTS